MDSDHEELVRRLALNDEATVGAALGMHLLEMSALDQKTNALVRLAGLIAMQSSAASYGWSVATALASGATEDEIIGVLVAIAPIVGIARVVQASADVATAVGVELDLPDWG